MSTPAVTTGSGVAPEELPTEGLPPGFGVGLAGKVAFAIAVVFSLFQLYTAAYGALPSQIVRAMHVGFLLLLGFGLIANLRAVSAPARRGSGHWVFSAF